MPAYSFSLPQFETSIPEGIKVRTTRFLNDGMRFDQARKAMIEGRPARLYWKQRTKDCHLLLEAPIVEVETVFMYPAAKDMLRPTADELRYRMVLEMKGRVTNHAQRNLYGREEGFAGDNQLTPWESFLKAFFRLHGIDFVDQPLYTMKWQRPEVEKR